MASAPCYCPVCRRMIDDFVAGGAAVVRPRALCPLCRSIERHRVMALLLDSMAPFLAAARVVLDVAPTPALTPILAREVGGLHLTTDVDPAADRRRVMVQSDLTALPLPDDSVDVVICMQVLEHIPDDAAAMREIRRVLAPGGLAFINVPYRAGTVTDEDPSASPEERTRRFGQADHVRFYGDDVDDRLAAAGFGFVKASSLELFGDELVHRLGLAATETFWFAWKDPSHEAPALPRFDTLHAFAVLSAGASTSLVAALKPWVRAHLPASVLQRIRDRRSRREQPQN